MYSVACVEEVKEEKPPGAKQLFGGENDPHSPPLNTVNRKILVPLNLLLSVQMTHQM